MKMRRIVVIPKHQNNDTVKSTYFGHIVIGFIYCKYKSKNLDPQMKVEIFYRLTIEQTIAMLDK